MGVMPRDERGRMKKQPSNGVREHDPSSEEEARRNRFLESQGYRVLRFWNNKVLENPDGVQTVIAQDLRRGHPHPTPPPSRRRAE